MKKISIIVFGAAMLAGCASIKPQMAATPSIHHSTPIAKPAVAVAPVPAPPSPKQTFRRRWLRMFFRDRTK